MAVDSETSVEEACDKLLSEETLCLAIENGGHNSGLVGLFDFADVNAFLTVAATRHNTPEVQEIPQIEQIIKAARAGHVPIRLVSNLSQKNPLEVLPYEATVISLLELFSKGTHRVLIRACLPAEGFLGIVSDRGLLSWFSSYVKESPSFTKFLSKSLNTLSLPSINLYSSVVAASANDTVLDAMKLMSEEGVSSVAVLENENGVLLSAVSVTDIGKIVVPSQTNQILSTPLHHFISFIKAPVGETDGAEKYPVYSVLPSSTLLHALGKLLATNAHRVFVSTEPPTSSPILSPTSPGNLCGIVSIVDVLSLFAKMADIPDVDPTRMQRHRRASSSSSGSLSRSNSRTAIRRLEHSHHLPGVPSRSSMDSALE